MLWKGQKAQYYSETNWNTQESRRRLGLLRGCSMPCLNSHGAVDISGDLHVLGMKWPLEGWWCGIWKQEREKLFKHTQDNLVNAKSGLACVSPHKASLKGVVQRWPFYNAGLIFGYCQMIEKMENLGVYVHAGECSSRAGFGFEAWCFGQLQFWSVLIGRMICMNVLTQPQSAQENVFLKKSLESKNCVRILLPDSLAVFFRASLAVVALSLSEGSTFSELRVVALAQGELGMASWGKGWIKAWREYSPISNKETSCPSWNVLVYFSTFKQELCAPDVTSPCYPVDNRMNLHWLWSRNSTQSLVIVLFHGAGGFTTTAVFEVYAAHTLFPSAPQQLERKQRRNLCDVLAGTQQQCDSSIDQALGAGACYSVKPACFFTELQKAAGYVKRAENKECSVEWRHN